MFKERWKLNLMVLWISQVISLTSFGFGLPFMPFYIQELGVTDPNALRIYTGILSAAPALTMAFMSPVWGYLSDRFGQKLMIQRAMLAAVFIIGAMGLSRSVNQLVALRFMQGLFTGTITASSAFVAVNTPNHKLSFALGFLSSSTFIGYSLGPFLGGLVAEHYGYRMSFYIGAILMLVGFVVVSVFLKAEKKASYRKTAVIQGHGYLKQLVSATILSLLIMIFLQRMIRTFFTPFIPLYIQEMQGTLVGAASLTGQINGYVGFASALSAIMISRMGDKYSKVKMIQIMLILGGVVAILLGMTVTLAQFMVLYVLLYFIIGGIEPLLTAATAELTPADKRGTLFGVQGLVGSLGWMVSPAIGTYVSIRYSLRDMFSVLACMIVLNFCATLLVNKRRQTHVTD